MRTTPNDVNVNTKTIAAAAPIAGRMAGRVISRNTRARRRAERGRGGFAVAGQRRQHGADRAHDDGEVEQHVGGDDRHDAPLDRRRQDSEHGGADHDGRQHEHGDEGAVEERRPGKSKRAMTYAGARPSTTVSAVETSACHSVNHTTSHVTASSRVSASADRLETAAEHRGQRPGVEHGTRTTAGDDAGQHRDEPRLPAIHRPHELVQNQRRTNCRSRSRSSRRGSRRSSPGRSRMDRPGH